MARATFERGKKLDRWAEAVRNPVRALKQIGLLMVGESRRAFDAQKFGRDSWDPRAVPNLPGVIGDFASGRTQPKERRFDQRNALVDTGNLRRKIAPHVIGTHSVEVGTTDVGYAYTMHEGGVSESDPITKEVQERLAKWLRGKGSEWRESFEMFTRPEWLDQRIETEVPARPFLGITRKIRDAVRRALGLELFEIRGVGR